MAYLFFQIDLFFVDNFTRFSDGLVRLIFIPVLDIFHRIALQFFLSSQTVYSCQNERGYFHEKCVGLSPVKNEIDQVLMEMNVCKIFVCIG